MDLSLFDVIGPVMIGPSSSHTAGAARLSRIAAQIAGDFTHVSFGLHGSFAETYRGHGTDKALVAGILGISQQDERLRDSFALAKAQGITYDFYPTELEGVHENTVCMTFVRKNGERLTIVGSSIGGGQIVITRLGEYPCEITASSATLVITQKDQKGMVHSVTEVLANRGINIGVMRLSRTAKGEMACCVIETDDVLEPDTAREIEAIDGILSARIIGG